MSASRKSSPARTTPPKGRPTPPREQRTSSWSDHRVTVQWALVGLAILGLIVLAVYIGADQDPRPLHGG